MKNRQRKHRRELVTTDKTAPPMLAGGEGAWRGPFYGFGELGGIYKINPLGDGWQNNLTVTGQAVRYVAAPYACVMLNARAVSQCKPRHLRNLRGGGFEEVTDSNVTRIVHKPNGYETWTQLVFNTVTDMLFDGASLWVTPDEGMSVVHRIPYGCWTPQVEPDSRELFYGVGGYAEIVPEFQYAVPARLTANFRQYTPRHPLIGEPPVRAAALALGINVALSKSQLAFFTNMNRPSGILTTEQQLNPKQIKELRTAFEEQAVSWASGGVPILASGLQFKAAGIAQNDAQLIEQQRMSLSDVCRVYGVPIALLSENSGPQGGTSALIEHWLSIGLGSLIESLERTLDRLFNLPPGERIELDPTPLLRVDFAGRVDGLTKAVQGGLLTPDEARRREGYGSIKGGDSAFLQRQMTPMDQLIDLTKLEVSNAAKVNPPVEPAKGEPVDDQKSLTAEYVSDLLANARTTVSAAELDPAAMRDMVAGMLTLQRKAIL